MSVQQPVARGPRSATKFLWIAGVALVLAAGAYVATQLASASAAAEARSRLLADIVTATQKEPVDGDELQRLGALLKRLPDHETARDALAAKARLQLARGQAEAAQATFGAQAAQPNARSDEQSLGARILLRVQEGGVAEGAAAAGLLQQAMQMAEAAAAETRSPADLLRAWQAAERAGMHDRSAAFARQLDEQHAGSPEQKFVAFALAFDPNLGPAAVNGAAAGMTPTPVEGDAMLVFAYLTAKDLPAALRTAEAALLQAPGVGVVRWAAAVVFHACVLGSAPGSEERTNWVKRRDDQLAWMLRQGDVDEARRKKIEAMREQR